MSRRVAGLFLAAVTGLLVCVGLVLWSLAWWAVLPYAAVVIAGAVALSRKAAQLRPRPHTDGRTCSCCTTTVFDPVTVVERMSP